jgi:hypothetical protein
VKALLFLLLVGITANVHAMDDVAEDASSNFTNLVVGNEVLAFGGYASGTNWLALACNVKNCVLAPARLSVHAAASTDAAGYQQLTFTLDKPSHRKVIAWLQRNPQQASWLHSGAVVTYGSIVQGLKHPRTPGTFELSVTGTKGEIARFVPLLDRKLHEFVLQLRSDKQRQLFDQQLWTCTGAGNTDYLLWAGDLDRDGQPDYLVSFADDATSERPHGYGKIMLYLSSAAEQDELVGAAAEYQDDTMLRCPTTDDNQ